MARGHDDMRLVRMTMKNYKEWHNISHTCGRLAPIGNFTRQRQKKSVLNFGN